MLCDSNDEALNAAKTDLDNILQRLKLKIASTGKRLRLFWRIFIYKSVDECWRLRDDNQRSNCRNLSLKRQLFQSLEKIAPANTILASNTSSLSIAAIAGKYYTSERIWASTFLIPHR
ncbi:MAG: 3-hydroxyacyl-CoA dehydrogenase NAD-binding domain-containing protein [Calditrichia bacterium]